MEGEALRAPGEQAAVEIQLQAVHPTTRCPFMRTDVVRSTGESQVSQKEASRGAGLLSSSLSDASVDVMTMPGCKAHPIPPPRCNDSS